MGNIINAKAVIQALGSGGVGVYSDAECTVPIELSTVDFGTYAPNPTSAYKSFSIAPVVYIKNEANYPVNFSAFSSNAKVLVSLVSGKSRLEVREVTDAKVTASMAGTPAESGDFSFQITFKVGYIYS
jgi:hypothetical protein